EILVAIEQDQLVGFRSKQDDTELAKQVVAIDRAIFAVHPLDMAERITQRGKGVADHRPAGFTGKMGEPLRLGLGADTRSRADHHRLPPCARCDLAGTTGPRNIALRQRLTISDHATLSPRARKK